MPGSGYLKKIKRALWGDSMMKAASDELGQSIRHASERANDQCNSHCNHTGQTHSAGKPRQQDRRILPPGKTIFFGKNVATDKCTDYFEENPVRSGLPKSPHHSVNEHDRQMEGAQYKVRAQPYQAAPRHIGKIQRLVKRRVSFKSCALHEQRVHRLEMPKLLRIGIHARGKRSKPPD